MKDSGTMKPSFIEKYWSILKPSSIENPWFIEESLYVGKSLGLE